MICQHLGDLWKMSQTMLLTQMEINFLIRVSARMYFFRRVKMFIVRRRLYFSNNEAFGWH